MKPKQVREILNGCVPLLDYLYQIRLDKQTGGCYHGEDVMGKLKNIALHEHAPYFALLAIVSLAFLAMTFAYASQKNKLHKLDNNNKALVYCMDKNPALDEPLLKYLNCVVDIQDFLKK